MRVFHARRPKSNSPQARSEDWYRRAERISSGEPDEEPGGETVSALVVGEYVRQLRSREESLLRPKTAAARGDLERWCGLEVAVPIGPFAPTGHHDALVSLGIEPHDLHDCTVDPAGVSPPEGEEEKSMAKELTEVPTVEPGRYTEEEAHEA
jgi:hypothetical protein